MLIKASAGGGGKGMRRVDHAEDFQASLSACKREALNAFGDDRVLIEKYVLNPRHIEIQVFADAHGNCVHLFERDCSVQRRHQKVLEEAPAPGMTPERRAAMGQAAVDAACAVSYVGAGTVEFIADRDGKFYFMEMNTRLQVEHPVTEMVTGVDLVDWQLRVAAGEELPLTQEGLALNGHAIEARIYAEDPDNEFLPSVGQLLHLVPPIESPHIRVDTGVERGDEITPHYDPMIAKLIVRGRDRDEALARMRSALAQYRIVGVQSNVSFLSRLVTCSAFATADLDTALIEREAQFLFMSAANISPEVWWLAALAELLHERYGASRCGGPDVDSPWRIRDDWRLNAQGRQTFSLRIGDITETVHAEPCRTGWVLTVGEHSTLSSGELGADGQIFAAFGEHRLSASVFIVGERRHVFFKEANHVLTRVDSLQQGGHREETTGELRAPMPGRIIALLADAGARVEKGAPLLVMEAMKMEHTINAPANGLVKAFHCELGDQVTAGLDLVDFEVTP